MSQCWFHLTDLSQGWSDPGLCLDRPLLPIVSPWEFNPLLIPIYMCMILKSIFSAPTEPGISEFMCLTACWSSLFEYIIDTSYLTCSKLFLIWATLALTCQSFLSLLFPISLRDITSRGVCSSQKPKSYLWSLFFFTDQIQSISNVLIILPSKNFLNPSDVSWFLHCLNSVYPLFLGLLW